jgi:GGDEF domain-containing protein
MVLTFVGAGPDKRVCSSRADGTLLRDGADRGRRAARGSLLDPTSSIVTADLSLDDEGSDLWEEILPHLLSALTGGEERFLYALEAAGRGASLTQKVAVADLLDAYVAGSEQVAALLPQSGDDDAERLSRRLLGLEHVALTRLAVGYSAGLQETIDQLRRLADEASPVDARSGAMKPTQLDERLSLEVERCRRMDLPLGLVELAVDDADDARRSPRRAGVVSRQLGSCLRESLRRYDSVGLTQGGEFVLVLPDISRRGLAGAAERLRRRLGASSGSIGLPDVTFALAHYDVVDASATEMLASLDHSMDEARKAKRPLAWA